MGSMLAVSAVDSRNWAVRTRSTSPTISQSQNKITLNSDWLFFLSSSRDRRGNLVAGMQQSIEVFNSEDGPPSLVLLIDDDLKDDNAQQVVASLHSILAGISSVDEPAVWAFDLTLMD